MTASGKGGATSNTLRALGSAWAPRVGFICSKLFEVLVALVAVHVICIDSELQVMYDVLAITDAALNTRFIPLHILSEWQLPQDTCQRPADAHQWHTRGSVEVVLSGPPIMIALLVVRAPLGQHPPLGIDVRSPPGRPPA